ncbi:hypothetical protein F2Q68_00035651 [Brassica cretica]|uniref:Uncharacterized protein n=1 Tax=Brassica cretica TaxID=69181 RepID=A0A8S9H584_BRACR|nr:hypothetical protein F2Q68_00035651 [Brassica cretica]
MLSAPEPVLDHTRISQDTVGSTALDPVSSPHGHPAHQSIPFSTSLVLIVSIKPLEPAPRIQIELIRSVQGILPYAVSRTRDHYLSNVTAECSTIVAFHQYTTHISTG